MQYVCLTERKTQDNALRFSVAFEDFNNIDIDKKGLVKLKVGPAGLTLIHKECMKN